MNRRQKILNSIAAIAIVVALTLGGYYIADSVTGKNTTLADNLRALGFDLPRAKVSVPTTQTTEVLVSASGAAGAAGVAGAAGNPGSSGAAGATGKAGVSGKPGSTGTSGLPGDSGPTGSTGSTGDSGPAGATGATGATGSTGSSGSDGTNGAAGSAGSNGTNGTNGTNGAAGSAGANGTNGNAGAAGPQGPAGSSGGSLTTVIVEGHELKLELNDQVFGLTEGAYVLPNGTEGQRVYFFAADNPRPWSITISIENVRLLTGDSVTVGNAVTWTPFDVNLPSVTMVNAIFVQGSWTLSGGSVAPAGKG